jgi:FG-GAP-like repeat
LNRNPILVGDVNGDGKNEIVAMEIVSPTTFTLGLFANDGSPLAWQVPAALAGTPVVMAAGDLDNDGKLETIVAANTDSETFLHLFQADGTERPGWPLTLYNSNINSLSQLAVADLNLADRRRSCTRTSLFSTS